MINKEYSCRKCKSKNIVKNGTNKAGSAQYKCKDCKSYGVLEPKIKYNEERKKEIIRTYQERASMRGIQRIFGVSRPTLCKWLKKKLNLCQNFTKR